MWLFFRSSLLRAIYPHELNIPRELFPASPGVDALLSASNNLAAPSFEVLIPMTLLP